MFAESLRKIVEEVPGGLGAVLMGYDGIAVDQHFRSVDGIDLTLVAVEYAAVLKEIKNAAQILRTGELEEVTIVTTCFNVLIRTLNDDYFVALTLEREGNTGKGRFLLLRESVPLREGLL